MSGNEMTFAKRLDDPLSDGCESNESVKSMAAIDASQYAIARRGPVMKYRRSQGFGRFAAVVGRYRIEGRSPICSSSFRFALVRLCDSARSAAEAGHRRQSAQSFKPVEDAPPDPLHCSIL